MLRHTPCLTYMTERVEVQPGQVSKFGYAYAKQVQDRTICKARAETEPIEGPAPGLGAPRPKSPPLELQQIDDWSSCTLKLWGSLFFQCFYIFWFETSFAELFQRPRRLPHLQLHSRSRHPATGNSLACPLTEVMRSFSRWQHRMSGSKALCVAGHMACALLLLCRCLLSLPKGAQSLDWKTCSSQTDPKLGGCEYTRGPLSSDSCAWKTSAIYSNPYIVLLALGQSGCLPTPRVKLNREHLQNLWQIYQNPPKMRDLTSCGHESGIEMSDSPLSSESAEAALKQPIRRVSGCGSSTPWPATFWNVKE